MRNSMAERRRRSPRNIPSLTVDAAVLRRRIEDDIEKLVGLLDALDGDPDLEPSLGGPCFYAGKDVDLEGDDHGTTRGADSERAVD